jgi:hypothetical protein
MDFVFGRPPRAPPTKGMTERSHPLWALETIPAWLSEIQQHNEISLSIRVPIRRLAGLLCPLPIEISYKPSKLVIDSVPVIC